MKKRNIKIDKEIKWIMNEISWMVKKMLLQNL
jgi:hypothetical protein